MPELTAAQIAIVEAPIDAKVALHGPAGCGKTTAAVERVLALIRAGVPADSILVLTPQRTLQDAYIQTIQAEPFAGGEVTPATLGGLARRMVDLFWPLAAQAAGFANPDQPPIFLTMESAQYYMAHLVRPLLDTGYFESVTIDRNRLYSQILDNLNKAALVGFDYRTLGDRLNAAWTGDPAQRRVYADVQDCANRFRDFCLQNNLLDFSLQLEIFYNILWNEEVVRRYLVDSYRHLVYDNVEEDFPIAHDLVAQWLPALDSALLIYDEGSGFRRFLGADSQSGWNLLSLCGEQASFQESFVMSEPVIALEQSLVEAIQPSEYPPLADDTRREALHILRRPDEETGVPRFYPELLDSIVAETRALLEGGLPPSEVVILSPYLSDALRFSLMNRLEAAGVPTRSHRPSRSLREEPASQAVLTLAALAHQDWGLRPTHFDMAYALMMALDADLVRAQLLTEITYRQKDASLSPFENIKPEMQERITYLLGGRYTLLRDWLDAYRQETPLPLDHFLRKLFGEVLSQPGFGFHTNLDAARAAASLVESIYKFRLAFEPIAGSEGVALGREYIQMLQDGVIAAQYLLPYQVAEDAVLVAPATTFLMMNRPVSVQFWIDPGAAGWSERLSQPLTHPFVLSRGWEAEASRTWTDADEVKANSETLTRLVTGLLRRCRQRIYLGLSNLGESGYEQRGDLLRAFQRVLQEN